jgi:hypothetical protein
LPSHGSSGKLIFALRLRFHRPHDLAGLSVFDKTGTLTLGEHRVVETIAAEDLVGRGTVS